MEKFEVTMKQVRVACFCIEANDAEEAKKLFVKKMREDDYFVDRVYECLELGEVDEEIKSIPIKYDGNPDFTYKYMTEKNEEDE